MHLHVKLKDIMFMSIKPGPNITLYIFIFTYINIRYELIKITIMYLIKYC